MAKGWIIPICAGLLTLSHSVLKGAESNFPVDVSAWVAKARPDSAVRVLLERDVSSRWQQYLTGASVGNDGGFRLEVHRPGVYWLLATEETKWSYRRGACLLIVEANGTYAMKPVPRIDVGWKWGGPAATATCRDREIPFAVYRAKRSPRKVR